MGVRRCTGTVQMLFPFDTDPVDNWWSPFSCRWYYQHALNLGTLGSWNPHKSEVKLHEPQDTWLFYQSGIQPSTSMVSSSEKEQLLLRAFGNQLLHKSRVMDILYFHIPSIIDISPDYYPLDQHAMQSTGCKILALSAPTLWIQQEHVSGHSVRSHSPWWRRVQANVCRTRNTPPSDSLQIPQLSRYDNWKTATYNNIMDPSIFGNVRIVPYKCWSSHPSGWAIIPTRRSQILTIHQWLNQNAKCTGTSPTTY